MRRNTDLTQLQKGSTFHIHPGYVSYIDHCGSDETIVEAARMSTNKGFVGWPEDEKLLTYLWKNKHTTPFEMAECILEVQAPIFVFREWHRHRTQSYNELSARYTQMPNLHWEPTIDRLRLAKSSNKQAQSLTEHEATDEELNAWLIDGTYLQENIYEHYKRGLELGIPKEVARYLTPVNRMSRMRAKANLLNWINFLYLRDDSHAQLEIQQYAQGVRTILETLFPHTMRIAYEFKP